MNKERYVSYEIAKLLKEKGFDWECNSWVAEYKTGVELHTDMERRNYNDDNVSLYDGLFSAPTQQMAQRWLREEFYIDVLPMVRHVNKFAGELPIKEYSYRIYDSEGNVMLSGRDWFRAYEKSIESALEYALRNLI